MTFFDVVLTDQDKEECFKLCKQFLGSEWTDLAEADFSIEAIKGGLCNRIFLCINNQLANSANDQEVTSKVVVRFYGHPFVGERGDMIGIDDSAIAIISSKLEVLDMGPKIYGIFSKGRIEEYIAHDAIDNEMKYQHDVVNELSRKMALIHSLTMPISKDPNFILDSSLKFYIQGCSDIEQRLSELEPEDSEVFKPVLSLDVKKEVEWLKQTATKVQSPPVFCHNDIKFGNIGLRKDREKLEDRLFIFDYENCSYNYRGYDLAFLLNWYNFDFSQEEFWKYWKMPSQELINEVIDDYLEKWKKLSTNLEPTIDNKEHLMMEIDFCVIMVQLLYSCVLIKRISKSFLFFANKFSKCKNGNYYDYKRKFLQKYSSLLGI